MALEPMVPTADEQNPELADRPRRFVASAARTVPLLVLMTSELLPAHPLDRIVPVASRAWVELALAALVVAWAGWPLLVHGWQSVVT